MPWLGALAAFGIGYMIAAILARALVRDVPPWC